MRGRPPAAVQGNRAVRRAKALLSHGDFEGAYRSCGRVALDRRLTASDCLLVGRLGLLTNRLDRARRALSAALERGRRDPTASMLAETCYRSDEFDEAARWFRRAGRTAMARKLESFGGERPYDTGSHPPATLRMFQVDPLPGVGARVNDRADGNFLLDTGGSELYLDSEFADRVGAARFGREGGTFAGGKRASYEHGRVDRVRLGRLEVRNVPVHIVPLGHLRGLGGRRRVHGIVGTVFLYHFASVIDYLGARLLLAPRTGRAARRRAGPSGPTIPVRFGLDGDHFIVAGGAVNGSPASFFIDSGLAGGGFTCPASTLRDAGIPMPGGTGVEGQGGGGAVRARRFIVDRLDLGRAHQEGVVGWYGMFPDFLEHEFGYRIGGLLSHGFLRSYRLTLDFAAMRLYLAT